MTCKILRNKGLANTIKYNLKDGSIVINKVNLLGSNVFENIREMELELNKFKGRARNLVAHVIISPPIELGKQLTLNNYKHISEVFLNRMGYSLERNKSIWYLHTDKEHIHLHRIINRVSPEGKLFRPFENELVLARYVGQHQISQELGLDYSKLIKVNQRNGIVNSIKSDLDSAILNCYSLEPNQIFETLLELLKNKGYEIKSKIIKDKISYGVKKNGQYFSASDLGNKYTVSKILQLNIATSNQREIFKKSMDLAISKSLKNGQVFCSKTYFKELVNEGYKIIFHHKKRLDKNKNQLIHGYSISKDGLVITSSEIGKNYNLLQLRKKYRAYTPKNIGDLEKIEQILFNCTTNKSHNSLDDLILTLREQNLSVGRWFENGKIAGLRFKKGRNEYYDKEIGRGAYTLKNLMSNGVIKALHNRYVHNPTIQETEKLKKLITNRVKHEFETKLETTISSLKLNENSIKIENVFSKTSVHGFNITYDNKLMHDYKVEKGQIHFSGSELRSHLSMQNLLRLELNPYEAYQNEKKMENKTIIDEIEQKIRIQNESLTEQERLNLIFAELARIVEMEYQNELDYYDALTYAGFQLLNKKELLEKKTMEYKFERYGLILSSNQLVNKYQLENIIKRKKIDAVKDTGLLGR